MTLYLDALQFVFYADVGFCEEKCSGFIIAFMCFSVDEYHISLFHCSN